MPHYDEHEHIKAALAKLTPAEDAVRRQEVKAFGASPANLEKWRLSPANPNRAMALAMRGEPTEAFTPDRGRNMVDAVRHFEHERWQAFVAFYEAKDGGDLKGESESKGQEIFDEAWAWIGVRIRSGEIGWSAVPKGELKPIDLPGYLWGQVRLTDSDMISQSERVIGGKHYVDVRLCETKGAAKASLADVKGWVKRHRSEGYVWKSNEAALEDIQRDLGKHVSMKRLLEAKRAHGDKAWKQAGAKAKPATAKRVNR